MRATPAPLACVAAVARLRDRLVYWLHSTQPALKMLERTKLPAAPQAERRPAPSSQHGVTLRDDFAWLRAANWQEVMRDPSKLDPTIRAYLEAENAYAEAALADTRALQDTLFAEMKGRIKEDRSEERRVGKEWRCRCWQ